MGNANVKKTGLVQGPEDYSNYEDKDPKYYMYKDDVAKIRYSETGIASRNGCPHGDTGNVLTVLQAAAEKWGDEPALRVERPLPPLSGKSAPPSSPRNEWKTWTYKEYLNDVRRAAKGYLKLGAVRYDGVSILGFNSPEWFMAEVSAMAIGGKGAGIYPTDTPEQVEFKASLSDSSIAVVDNKASFERFAKVIDQLEYLKAIVCWDYPEVENLTRSNGSVVKCMTWDALLELGDSGDDQAVDQLIKDTKPGNVACLVFTSGTTGNPKAVMVSHDALLFESYNVLAKGVPAFGAQPNEERVLSYLPLSHVAGMMVDIMSPIVCTAYREGYVCVHFARPYDLKVGTLGDRLRAVQPTMFLGVPRVWEKIAEKMKAVGAKTTGIKKTLSTWAKAQSLHHQKNCLVGGDGSKGWGFGVANVLLKAIKGALGLDQCKFMFSGAAPLTIDTLEYFAQIGININEVYGMSESTGATTWSTDEMHMHGSIGYEMSGCEVKVFEVKEDGSKTECPLAKDFHKPSEAEQGELCFRGRHIMMGYLANPKLGQEHVNEMKKKNAETIDEEGWLHSGDKGSKDVKLMYRITGRYKELIITAGGENVAPVPIEDELKKECPAISNAMMVGDKRKFNCVLITLKAVGATGEHPGTDELDGAAASYVPGVSTISAAMESEEYISKITAAITKVNQSKAVVSNASKIQKFTILPRDFSVDTGEITPSLKLKRSVVQAMENNSQIIDAIYDAKNLKNNYVNFNQK